MKTAYKADQYFKFRDDAYMRLQAAFYYAKDRQTSKQLNQEVNSIIGSVPEKPLVLRATLRGFADALYRRVDREQTCFLYKVDGNFYSVTSSKDTGFPSWHTLPREMWDQLGDCGGTYWRGSYKPFFIRNDS